MREMAEVVQLLFSTPLVRRPERAFGVQAHAFERGQIRMHILNSDINLS